jgi:hypothetical protein
MSRHETHDTCLAHSRLSGECRLDVLNAGRLRVLKFKRYAVIGGRQMKFRFAFQIVSLAGAALGLATVNSSAESGAPVPVDQGKNWTETARTNFYSHDQGSRLIPLRWIAALKQPDGEPFLAASLSRYGYLPNEASTPPGLPVGFTVASEGGVQTLGLTCSACHTRQIEAGGKSYRIDGGPAIADLGAFWGDLDIAVNKVLTDQGAFADFGQAVLGPSPSPGTVAGLRDEVLAWFTPAHAIAEYGLPKDNPWGPGRLDAVGMILNRVAGLDIGPPPTYIIPENIKFADAPVRPPFLWNASRQDTTQWPGFAPNGDKILALLRNLGEVYGVFGVFHPKKDESHLLGFNYVDDNTANFQGLAAQEELIENLGPPKWPREWPVDGALASAGKAIYERHTEQDGCVDCHGIKPGEPRLLNKDTWRTPIQDVHTDSREYNGLVRKVDTGALEGAQIPNISPPLKPNDGAVNVLGLAVKATVLQEFFPITVDAKGRKQWDLTLKLLDPEIQALKEGYKTPKPAAGAAYEARVLEGIWAAAPYLHNGSVPTLAELLKPAAERVSEFKIGPAFDVDNVGLAVNQTKLNYTLKTTDCSDRNSGNSRCGHEYGTKLSPDEKKALLEYLKTL